MANYEINVRAKLDSSSLESELNSLKNRFQNMEIKITANMPDFDKDITSKGTAAGRKYSEAFKNSMSQKIQFKIDTGDFEAKINGIEQKLGNLGNVSEQTISNISALSAAFETMTSADASTEQKIQAYNDFNALLPTIRAQLSNVAGEERDFAAAAREAAQAQLTMTKSDTLSNQIGTWLEDNADKAGQYADRLREIQELLNGNTDPTMLRQLSAEFANIKSQVGTGSEAVSSFGSQFGRAIGMAMGIGSVYQIVNKVIGAIKDMVKTTIELEDAMAQLKIVTGASDDTLSSYFTNIAGTAKEIGGNIKDLIEATTTYSRLGYSLEESSILAKYTNMLQNVGDVDVSTAQNAITAITKAFDISADQIESVMDKLVAVGNNYPVSVSDLAQGINNAGSMLAAAGNSFEQTIAMLTAANATVQDISKSSTGLRTIAARIRKTDTELDELGESMTTAKYEALVQSLTDYNVALTDSEGNFRSTYDILKDLAGVWDELSNSQKAALAETIAGTRQQNVFFSLMEEFEEATNAMETMGNSFGALESAYGAYSDTTTAHINSLKSAWAEFSATIVDTSFVKGIVDVGRYIVEAFTAITKAFNGISIDDKISQTTSKLEGLYQKTRELSNSFERFDATSSKVVPRITELASGVDKYGKNISLTDEEYSEFLQLNNQLGQLVPDLVTGYDDSGNAMLALSYNADNLAESLQNLIDIQKDIANFEMSNTVSELFDTTLEQSTNYDKKIKEIMASATDLTADTPYTTWLAAIDNFTGSDNMTEIKRLDISNAPKSLKDRLAMAGISTYKEADQDWWKPMHEWVDLDSNYNDDLREILQGYSDLQNVGIDRQSNYYKYKQQQLYKDLSRAYSNYIKTEDWYGDLSDFGKILAQDYVDNIDYESLIEQGYSQTDIEKFIYDNARTAVDKANPQVTEAFEQLFDLKKKFQNGEISSEEFSAGASALIKSAFKNVQNQGQAKTLTGWFNAAGFSGSGYKEILDNLIIKPEEAAEMTLSDIQERIDTHLSDLSKVQSAMQKQFAGESISLDDYAALSEYNDALEYHNGLLTYNEEKVQQIAEAKRQESLAQLASNKASSQAEYLKNAKEIEEINRQLKNNADLTEEDRRQLEAHRDSLKATNKTLYDDIVKNDIMRNTLNEATDAYHNWLNAQKAAQSGDMFDDALSAIQHIDNTLKNQDSDFFGRIGRSDYKAALDFVIPDTVDREDEAAVQSYMDSIKDLFTYDGNGNRTGFDRDNFLAKAVESGLMSIDDMSGDFQLAGSMTMKEFADGMGLALPLVQAIFGELQEFGYNFTFNVDVEKTFEDIAVAGHHAIEKLNEDFKGANFRFDFDGIENQADKLAAIEQSIKQAQAVMNRSDADSSQIEAATQALEYYIQLKQQLTEPAIMQVDTSSLTGEIQNVMSLLQEFQTAMNNLEKANLLGDAGDIEAAQAEVDALLEKINGLDGTSASITAELGIEVGELTQEELQSKIQGISPEVILEVTGVDLSAVEPSEFDQDGTVAYTADYSGIEEPPQKDGTVAYTADYSGVSEPPAKHGVVYYKEVMTKATGSAQTTGNAKAGGDWRTSVGGRTLLGELGREIVVDPRTGRWYTVGDNGAEFKYIPKGSIVFNNKQSEALLKYGHVGARGLALASGTLDDKILDSFSAILGGSGSSSGGNVWTGNGSNSGGGLSASSSSSGGNLSSSSGGSGSSSKDPEKFDWIEIAIDRIERAIKRLARTAESAYKSVNKKLRASNQEIKQVNKEIDTQIKAYNRYMKEANSVKLSDDLKRKVRDGTIDITKYNEKTQELIDEYQKWYEKALDAKDAIDELHESLAKLYEDNFKYTQEDFENKLSLIEHITKYYQSGIDMLEAKGYLESTKYYQAMQNTTKRRIKTLEDELSGLETRLREAMDSGEIEKYSPAWYEMVQSINKVKEELADANIELVKFDKTIRQIEWGYFDYTQARISQLTKEANFLIDLLSNKDLYDDNGQLTEYGLATMGMHGQNYNVYMAQADDYANELLEIENQLANEPGAYDTELIERKEQLLALQQEAIKNAESEKQAIVNLVKEGIQIELNALKDLISKYKESLDNAKSLYDYQSKVSDKAAEIARIQKQLSAYAGDTSEETQATVQKLEVNLAKAQEDLAKTEYDKFISDSKKLLDNLYDEYEEVLNRRLDDVDALISDMIDAVNDNSDSINTTIHDVGDSVGYKVTDQMGLIWSNYFGQDSIIAKYGNDFLTISTATNAVVQSIHTLVKTMIENSDETYSSLEDSPAALEIINQMKANSMAWATASPEDRDRLHRENVRLADEYEYLTGNALYFRNGSWYDADGNLLYSFSVEEKVKNIVAAMKKNSSEWHSANAERRAELERQNEEYAAKVAELLGKQVTKKNGTWYLGDQELYKVYRKGGLVDYTGIAKVDGTPSNPELMLNAKDTQNFLALRDALRTIAAQPITSGGSFGFSGVDRPMLSVADIFDLIPKIDRPTIQQTNTVSFGDIRIDRVLDYNEFVRQLRDDTKFEQMLQDMTLGAALGKGSISKHKYQW